MDRTYAISLVQSFELGFITRREFMTRATIALGSAAAAGTVLAACRTSDNGADVPPEEQPAAGGSGTPEAATAAVAATAASTDASTEGGPGSGDPAGLVVETVEYDDNDGERLTGYMARPEGAASAPGVVVIQEWWGLNEHIENLTRRFANEGYVALAPDLYHGQVVDEPSEASKLVQNLDMPEAVREIQRAIAFLRQVPYVEGGVGVVGFCMGGRLALQTAVAGSEPAAVVAFYGTPPDPAAAGGISVPVLGLYGSEDQGITAESVRALEAALTDAGIPNEFMIYDGAGHAFFNDTRDSYSAEAANDAWTRTLAWFEEHL